MDRKKCSTSNIQLGCVHVLYAKNAVDLTPTATGRNSDTNAGIMKTASSATKCITGSGSKKGPKKQVIRAITSKECAAPIEGSSKDVAPNKVITKEGKGKRPATTQPDPSPVKGTPCHMTSNNLGSDITGPLNIDVSLMDKYKNTKTGTGKLKKGVQLGTSLRRSTRLSKSNPKYNLYNTGVKKSRARKNTIGATKAKMIEALNGANLSKCANSEEMAAVPLIEEEISRIKEFCSIIAEDETVTPTLNPLDLAPVEPVLTTGTSGLALAEPASEGGGETVSGFGGETVSGLDDWFLDEYTDLDEEDGGINLA